MGFPRLTERLRRGRVDPSTPPQSIVSTVSDQHRAILREVAPFTMTSAERQVALIDAVDHVVSREVPGALVECGVWRGGSVLAMILRLQQLEVDDREIYLYDTFDGMTRPGELDVSRFEPRATEEWASADGKPWARLFDEEVFNLDLVRELVAGTGYPTERVHFVVGDVLETIPDHRSDPISLLRLDTDWYESTRHELEHLYPRLSADGVLIIDDYGHWQGSQQAVDEYFDDRDRPFLVAVDYTCRVGVRPR